MGRILPLLLLPILLVLSSCGETIYRLQFAGYNCEIPRRFFPAFARPDTEAPGQLFLDYYLPGFTRYQTRKLDPAKQGGHGDRINATLNPKEVLLLRHYAALASMKADGAPYVDRFGLRQTEYVHWAARPERRKQLLLYAAEGQSVKTVINCNPNEPSPPCTHDFNRSGIHFQLTYSLDHLPQWRSIEEGSALLFARLCR